MTSSSSAARIIQNNKDLYQNADAAFLFPYVPSFDRK